MVSFEDMDRKRLISQNLPSNLNNLQTNFPFEENFNELQAQNIPNNIPQHQIIFQFLFNKRLLMLQNEIQQRPNEYGESNNSFEDEFINLDELGVLPIQDVDREMDQGSSSSNYEICSKYSEDEPAFLEYPFPKNEEDATGSLNISSDTLNMASSHINRVKNSKFINYSFPMKSRNRAMNRCISDTAKQVEPQIKLSGPSFDTDDSNMSQSKDFQIIKKRELGYSFSHISKELNTNVSSVKRTWYKYQKFSDTTDRRKQNGRKCILSERDMDLMRKETLNNPKVTAEELKEILQLSVSIRSVRRARAKLGFVFVKGKGWVLAENIPDEKKENTENLS